MIYCFPDLEPVCCSMSGSICCFLTCIQISPEAGNAVLYSYLFKNFPQFVLIHTVKCFGVVNKAGVDVFLELSCFFYDPTDVGNLISASSAFPNPTWTSGSSQFTYCWSLAWRILSITFLVCEMNAVVPFRIRPSFPRSQSLPSGSFHKPLILVHQRADRLKTTITEN